SQFLNSELPSDLLWAAPIAHRLLTKVSPYGGFGCQNGRVRQGSVFRRCTLCRRKFGDKRRCPGCGGGSYSWTYVVDQAAPGAPRKQRMKGGFSTKAAAISAMNELQVATVSGTHVEPSKLTVGDYLKLWVAGGCGGVRPWTLRGYSAVVRVHLVP